MALAQEDIEQIRRLIREEVEARIPSDMVRYDLELRERMVRVGEELRHQRELMEQGFHLMEKRFEQIDKRFEQVDKHLELLERQLEQMREYNEKRFEQIDRRFEQIDRRFEQIDQRFERLTERIDRFMRWSFATTLAVGSLVVAAIKYLP